MQNPNIPRIVYYMWFKEKLEEGADLKTFYLSVLDYLLITFFLAFLKSFFFWHSFAIDQSRRASFASARQSSMETPPNATPQPFRQPVSTVKPVTSHKIQIDFFGLL